MELLTGILLLMGRVMLETITSPLFISIYLILFTIVCWQYKRLENMSEKLIKTSHRLFLRSACLSSIVGIFGGLLGSILLIMIGINLENIGLVYLWLLALLLMLINPRFLCFAYAAGILSLFCLVFSYPLISVPHLLALVAILHMIESFLILINGHSYPIPLYVKKQGQIVGGFNLQKFWPLPLMVLVGVGSINPMDGLSMPQWWPLLQGNSEMAAQTFTLLPVVAILGYGEITTTSTPVQRVKKSSRNLFVYSLTLLFLAGLSCYIPVITVAAALFSPLGHELVIWLGMREENYKPLYIKSSQGVRIMNVKPGSPAQQAGIVERDIILMVNGLKVDHYLVARELIRTAGSVSLRIKREDQEINLQLPGAYLDDPGIIPVPEEPISRYIVMPEDKIFNLVKRLITGARNLRN